jgi:hypothetical protein
MQGEKLGEDVEEEPLEGLVHLESITPGNIASLKKR